MKRHLARIKSNAAPCKCIPYDVMFQKVENLKKISKSKEQAKPDQEASHYSPLQESLKFKDVQEVTPSGRSLGMANRSGPSSLLPRSNLGKRKVGDNGKYFTPKQHWELKLLLKYIFLQRKKEQG